MRLAFRCIGLLLFFGLHTTGQAELRTFSLPGDEYTWAEAQEGPLSVSRFLQVIDFERFTDGITPIAATELVVVPPIDLDLLPEAYSNEDPDSLFAFSRHVAQNDVVALQDVTLPDRTVLAGDILIPRLGDFPRAVQEIQLLRRAGITEIAALVNVAESYPRPPVAEKFNKALGLTTFGIFERTMSADRLQGFLAAMFDNNPLTSFERIDRVGNDVKQKWILYMDLGRFFPLAMIRFYPNVNTSIPVAGFKFLSGVPGTEKNIAGIRLDDSRIGSEGFPRFNKVARTFPDFIEELSTQVNSQDTVQVIFDPPKKLRYTRIDFTTSLDYDVAEIEFLADGFVPEATFTSKPIPLEPATLGRIFWEEEKIGDPERSHAVVRVQTGLNAEPLVLFRVDFFENEVEWKRETDGGAIVKDKRPGSETLGEEVDLNSAEFNLDAREIFSALSDEERALVRLSRTEYKELPGSLRRRVEPDLVFWSGFQPVENGGLLNAPSGRPFIQLEVRTFSDEPTAATAIRNLRFEYSSPQITKEIFGEIAPAVDVQAGQDTSFVMALKAKIDNTNEGFNRLQVFTPAKVDKIEDVVVDFGDGDAQTLERIGFEDSPKLPNAGQFKEILINDDQFVIGFPNLRSTAADSVLIKVRFTGRVIDFRTTFSGNVFLDTLDANTERLFTNNGILATNANADTLAFFLPQPIVEGHVLNFADVENLEDRNSLSVVADISSRSTNLVTNLRLEPNPFTPNGDRINDALAISYDIQRLLIAKQIEVSIYDLGGRRVKVFNQNVASGGYTQVWDGRDTAGNLVSPGMYILQISTQADESGEDVIKLISVVY